MGRLDGRVAIVTGAGGASAGSTRSCSRREGAAVVVDDIGSRTGVRCRRRSPRRSGPPAATATASTASATWDGAAEIVPGGVRRVRRQLDILVNNATAGRNDDLWHYTEAEWDLTIDVNLKGYFALIRGVDPAHGPPGRRARS